MEEASREILWNVPPLAAQLLYAGSLAALVIAAWQFVKRYHIWKLGRAADANKSFGKGLARIVFWVFRGARKTGDAYSGLMHRLILWGFLILFMGTTLVFLEDRTPLHFFYGRFYQIASLTSSCCGTINALTGEVFC